MLAVALRFDCHTWKDLDCFISSFAASSLGLILSVDDDASFLDASDASTAE